MKQIAFIISIISLIATLVPPFLVFTQQISADANKSIMLAGTVGWFVTAPIWMYAKKKKQPEESASWDT